MHPNSASPDEPERLEVTDPDQSVRRVPLQPGSLIIGRDPASDIPLYDPKASRQHARLDFDGQQVRVTDLGSTNGTYLASTRLTPGRPTLWSPSIPLRIGNTLIRWVRPGAPQEVTQAATTVATPLQRAAAPPPPGPTPPPAVPAPPAPPAATFSSAMRPLLLRPGEIGTVTIRNLSNQAQNFSLAWQSSSPEVQFTPPALTVNAAPGQEVVVEFRPDLKRTPLFGEEQRFDFSAAIRSAAGAQQSHHGQVVSQPWLPSWSLPLLVVLCVGLAFLGALAFALFAGGRALSPSQANTRTAAYTQTQAIFATAQTATAVEAANQATATALQSANLATQTAVAFEATLFAATQTEMQQAAATAVALTAQAQQATFQAAANQTAQAAQATQQAALAQTATAIQQTSQAGAFQTSAALTAMAAQLTNQAQAATQTAAAQRRLAYIYSSDTITASDYRTFLQSQGYVVDLIPLSAIMATNFNLYRAVLIGPETGDSSDYLNKPWGDAAEVQANTVAAYGKPILGLGRGGTLYFQAIGLYINYGNSWSGSGHSVYALNPSMALWSVPNPISIPADQIVKLYNAAGDFYAVSLPGPVAGVVPIARQSDDPDHYPLILQDTRFFLWGFQDGPSAMTLRGQRLLVNILWNLAP